MRMNRRMRKTRLNTIYHKSRNITKDNEGVPSIDYPGVADTLKAEYWPAGGQLQTMTYGDRVNNMLNIRVQGEYTIIHAVEHEIYDFGDFQLSEGDGLCIHVTSDDEPDYRIISITPHKPLKMEVERI